MPQSGPVFDAPEGPVFDTDVPAPPGQLAQLREDPNKGKGLFGEILPRLTGAKSLSEAGSNIAETAKMIGEPSKLYAGTKEFSKAVAQGMEELWKEIGSADYAKKKQYEAMGGMTGVSDLADAYSLYQTKDYGSALGAMMAGLVKLSSLIPKFKTPLPETKQFAKLASGEKIRVTPGMMGTEESFVSRIEPVAASIPAGGPIRAAYEQTVGEGESFMRRAMRDTAKDASGRTVNLPMPIDQAADMASEHIKVAGQELYKSIDAAMEQPGAQPIDLSVVSQRAQNMLDHEATRTLLAKTGVDPTIRTELEKISTRGRILTAGSTPAETYNAVLSARTKLLDLTRDRINLTPTDRFLARGLARDLTTAVAKGLRSTRPGLARQWLRANRLTYSAYSMKALADDLRNMLKTSTPEMVQTSIPGMAVRPRRVPARNLIETLNDMAYVPERLVSRPGRFPLVKVGRSHLGAAFPMAQDALTIRQIAEAMERTQQGGAMAGKFDSLGILRKLSDPFAGAIAGGIVGAYTHNPLEGLSILGAQQIGLYTIAQLLAHPGAGRYILQWVKTAPGSAREASLALRLNTLAQGARDDTTAPRQTKWKVTRKDGKSSLHSLNPEEADLVRASGYKVEDAEE